MRVLVTGDRNWRDAVRLQEGLIGAIASNATSMEGLTLISGDARGADTYADVVAQLHGIPVERFPADWDAHGRAAGPIRNKQMLDSGVDFCVAFHDDLGSSRGTRDMVERCEKAGVRVYIVGNDTR